MNFSRMPTATEVNESLFERVLLSFKFLYKFSVHGLGRLLAWSSAFGPVPTRELASLSMQENSGQNEVNCKSNTPVSEL